MKSENIFNIGWARRYLVIYWLFLTIFAVMFIIAIFIERRKIKKMKDGKIEKLEIFFKN